MNLEPAVAPDLPAGRPPREADLHQLWRDQCFPAGALTTVAGVPVRVLYRGRGGGGAGPDFRAARLSFGGAPPVLGDVEIHVHAADFRRHGHADDPAYRRVALHVVFDAGDAADTVLPGGGRAPVVALRQWVERRSAEIAALAAAPPWREPCHTALARLGDAGVRHQLEAAGSIRLRAKAAALANELAHEPPDVVLYRAVCG
jgi:hypothetical protein